jgi:hypothetical protein
MEDRMSGKLDTLDVKALLKKNPSAASVFRKNRKKLGENRKPRPPKPYEIGLPYTRPRLVTNDKNRDWNKVPLQK